MTERETIARAAASLDDPDAVMPGNRAAPERLETLIAISDEILSGLSGYMAADLTADDEMEATDIVRRILSALIDTPPPAEPAGDALRTIEGRMDRMIHDGFHRARYVEGFPYDESHLVMPLNDPDNGATHCVASLSVEDSGIGPALWNLALDMLSLRAALAATPVPQPACCLCDDRPQAPNNPCGACGKTAPQPTPADRETLVEVIREGCKGHGWLPEELPRAIADALLARGLRLPTDKGEMK